MADNTKPLTPEQQAQRARVAAGGPGALGNTVGSALRNLGIGAADALGKVNAAYLAPAQAARDQLFGYVRGLTGFEPAAAPAQVPVAAPVAATPAPAPAPTTQALSTDAVMSKFSPAEQAAILRDQQSNPGQVASLNFTSGANTYTAPAPNAPAPARGMPAAGGRAATQANPVPAPAAAESLAFSPTDARVQAVTSALGDKVQYPGGGIIAFGPTADGLNNSMTIPEFDRPGTPQAAGPVQIIKGSGSGVDVFQGFNGPQVSQGETYTTTGNGVKAYPTLAGGTSEMSQEERNANVKSELALQGVLGAAGIQAAADRYKADQMFAANALDNKRPIAVPLPQSITYDQFGTPHAIGGGAAVYDPANGGRFITNPAVSTPAATSALPSGLTVGATTKQPDGKYSLPNGQTATIKGGKITEIK